MVCACVVSRAPLCVSPCCCNLQARKGDNLSKEMKQRLRQEYYGLGGAENKVGAWLYCAAGSACVLHRGDWGFVPSLQQRQEVCVCTVTPIGADTEAASLLNERR